MIRLTFALKKERKRLENDEKQLRRERRVTSGIEFRIHWNEHVSKGNVARLVAREEWIINDRLSHIL